MKVIIDPYRGGNDTGNQIDNQYEKNILLNFSKYMADKFNQLGISTELVRNNDISLTDEERNSIINEIKEKNDIIIQNRLSDDNEFDIVYPLRNSDSLVSLISKDLEANNINVDKYYQRRLPTNTTLDYYSVIRNTTPNQSLIIEYKNIDNYQKIIDVITNAISKYIKKSNTYTVKKGDSLYQIALKYGTTVDKIKKLNNLTTDFLKNGQILQIPEKEEENETTPLNIYIVQKGDSLYQIALKYGTTVDKIKKLNNLTTDFLKNGQILQIPEKEEENETTPLNIYIVQKGDSLYQIAKKYNTTVDELKKINNLTSNTLSIGQKIILPTKSSQDTTEYEYYIVQKGDSLYQIGLKYNITTGELKKINNLSSNLLNIGQKLKVPRMKESYTTYIVQKGDSLYQIAKKYNTTVNELKTLNNITTNLLNIGQELKIPRWINKKTMNIIEYHYRW